MADTSINELRGYREEVERTEQAVSRLSRSQGDLKIKMEGLDKRTKEYKAYKKQLNDSVDQQHKLNSELDYMRKANAQVSRQLSVQTTSVSQYQKQLAKSTELYRTHLNEMQRIGKISADQYKKMIKDEASFQKVLRERAAEPVKLILRAESGDKEERMAARRQISKNVFGGMGGMVGGAADAVGIKSKTLDGMGGAFKSGMGATEKIGSSFKMMSGQMKAAGDGISMLSGALKALGIALKGMNWIGLIIGALKAVVSMVNELDKFVKELNRDWREMAGSPALLKNVRESMKEFNDAIFDVGRNMRMGLKASDIKGFFKSMTGSGMSLQGVKQRIGDYNQAITEGFKMSRSFGTSFSEMGSMMSNQMVNLRSSLDDVNDAFKTMAYGADVAGVKSQKFYQVVENVGMSLSFYGNHLKSTSAMLQKFVSTGTMGFKDASETVQSLMGTFKRMGIDQRRALVNIVGENEVREWFVERQKTLKAAIDKQGEVLKGTAEGSDERKAGERRQRQMRADERRVSRVVRSNDITGYAANLEMVAEKAMDAAIKSMANSGVNFFDDITGSMAYLGKVMLWSTDEINKATVSANVSFDILDRDIGALTSGLKKVKKEDMRTLARDVQDFFTDPNSSPILSIEDAIDRIKRALGKGTGGAGLDASELGPIIELIQNGGAAFSDIVEDLLTGSGKISRAQKGRYALKQGAVFTSKEAEASNQMMNDLVRQTTPLADYLDIGKENAKYALAGSNLQANIALATAKTAEKAGGIFGILVGWIRKREKKKGGSTPEEQFALAKDYAEGLYKRYYTMTGLRRKSQAEGKATPMLDQGLATTSKAISELENKYYDVSYAVDEARRAGMEASSTQLESMTLLDKQIEEGKKKQLEYGAALEDTTKSEEERMETLRRSGILNDEVNKKIAAYNALLEKDKNRTATFGPKGKLTTKETDETVPGFKKKEASFVPGTSMPGSLGHGSSGFGVKPIEDGIIDSGGWLKASSGDVFANADSLAKGTTFKSGELAGSGPGMIGGSGAGGVNSSFVINGLTQNFNGPMVGSPDDYRRELREAMEEIVDNKDYQRKLRNR